jgi:hypothetical protein
MVKDNNIGLPEYQKNMSLPEIIKNYYNKTEIGNSIFVVHKKSKDHQEYKFFCTHYQGKDYLLVSPKHWNTDFATHSDLMEIVFNLIGVEKKDIRKKLELYKTEFFNNAFHGTIGKNSKENTIHFCCLDECPDPTIKQEKLKKVPEAIQKVHKRLLNSLNSIIQSNKAKMKTNIPNKKIKKKPATRPKPRRR